MAAPVLTALGTPAGRFMKEGYVTRLAFAALPTVSLWIKSLKPPGVDGGDPIDITTMHNATWETMAYKALKKLTEGTFTAAYDPNIYASAQIQALININTSISVHYPDGSTLVFWGAMTKGDPSEHKRGEFPEFSVTFVPSNWDDVNWVEAAPVITSVPGT